MIVTMSYGTITTQKKNIKSLSFRLTPLFPKRPRSNKVKGEIGVLWFNWVYTYSDLATLWNGPGGVPDVHLVKIGAGPTEKLN